MLPAQRALNGSQDRVLPERGIRELCDLVAEAIAILGFETPDPQGHQNRFLLGPPSIPARTRTGDCSSESKLPGDKADDRQRDMRQIPEEPTDQPDRPRLDRQAKLDIVLTDALNYTMDRF